MKNKKNIDSSINYGKKLFVNAEYSKAIDLFDHIINKYISPELCLAYYYKGCALASLGRNNEAARYFLRYITLTPHESSENFLKRGNFLFDRNLLQPAIIFYDEAINKSPKKSTKLAKAHYYKGLTLAHLDKYQEAIFCFEDAILYNPKYVDAHYGKFMAIHALSLNLTSKASSTKKMLDCLNIVIRLNPKFVKAYVDKGMVLHDIGKYSEALAIYEEAIKIEFIDILYYNKALTLETIGENDKALECYNTLINLDPNNYHAYYKRGLFLKKRGSYDQAIKDFNMVLELAPDRHLLSLAFREKAQILSVLDEAKVTHENLEVTSQIEDDDEEIRFNTEKVIEPKKLSINRAFELSRKQLEHAQNSLAPPIGNRIFIGGMDGACYSLALSMELFFKGCILYYKGVWPYKIHCLERLKNELLEAAEQTDHKLTLTQDTLKKIEELNNLNLRYDVGEAGTRYFLAWHQIVFEILLQAPEYLYIVFMRQRSEYLSQICYGKEYQAVKTGLKAFRSNIYNTYKKLCSKEGCIIFIKQIKDNKKLKVILLDFMSFLVQPQIQKLVEVKHIKAINRIIKLVCLDNGGIEYQIKIQAFETRKDYEENNKQRSLKPTFNKKTIFIDIANCILFPDEGEYFTTSSSCISLELPKLIRDTKIYQDLLGYIDFHEPNLEKSKLLQLFAEIYKIMDKDIVPASVLTVKS